ncbi:MAG: hypothetical protein M4579_005745 [Chaenotheca gracillima]|nr:MAG: hypothetical protein M4579_005745 [Chaenotheca gracillima]
MPATQRRPRSRKSIAHLPSPNKTDTAEEKENLEQEVTGSLHDAKRRSVRPGSSLKKSRSKSIGPGGLDALKEGVGNRQKSQSIAAPAVRSILKPTIPLSPLREIPSRSAASKIAGTLKSSHGAEPSADMLIDFSVPESSSNTPAGIWGADTLLNPFNSAPEESENRATGKAINAGTQLQTDTAELEGKREADKKKEQARREARRKSLANRRVSFAPEATLHTWDVVEYFQESTTSTDSTRRASSVSARSLPETPRPQATSPKNASSAPNPPSTPPEQIEDAPAPSESPAHQRDLHQKKRRRHSSGTAQQDQNTVPNSVLSSSPYSTSSTAGSEDMSMQSLVMDNDDETSNSDSDSADENSAVMSVVGGESTSQSFASALGGNSPTGGSSGRLDEALRQAAHQAGTQGIEYDENGDLSMEIATEDTTAAFKPWSQQANARMKPTDDLTSFQDQENRNPFSPAFKSEMDTNASHLAQMSARNRPQSAAPRSQQSGQLEIGPNGEGSSLGDETMDFTMAVGGIEDQEGGNASLDEDEELSMELTTAMGGVLPSNIGAMKKKRQSVAPRSDRPESMTGRFFQHGITRDTPGTDDTAMDITMAVGGILTGAGQQDEEFDQTHAMDMTTAVGRILPKGGPKHSPVVQRSAAKEAMKRETDIGDLANSPIQMQGIGGSPSKISTTPTPKSTRASPRTASIRTRASSKRESTTKTGTPSKLPARQTSASTQKPSTPSKQLTPSAPRPITPGKTPPLKNVTMRSASPKRLFQSPKSGERSTPRSARGTKGSDESMKPGISTPSIILAPKRRRSSGLGVDKEGLGSPKVTALFEKRHSLGQVSQNFSLDQAQKNLRFQDPQNMEAELDRERQEDERREQRKSVLQVEADVQESDDNDATANLREMIQSLTPKKKLKGRKSLHVGAARGILGKRPIELDEEEEEEDESSIKKFKGREGSPVKNVMLPPPPPKIATSGRPSRAHQAGLLEQGQDARTATPSIGASPSKPRATTPSSQGKFRNVQASSEFSKPMVPSDERIAQTNQSFEEENENEPIHLQDFLNMTSIRFMELTTTKRRPTIAPGSRIDHDLSSTRSPPNRDTGDKETATENLFGRSVVAGASTVPMLELYQHSCRELKKYISEGRKIVREIEADTFEENPPLFREYMSASPDVRFIMDAQFKNVKTHARLLSKAMWYEWRMKLLDGLKEGLGHISQGMTSDHEILQRQENAIQPILEPLAQEFDYLEEENYQLQERVDELQDCDQEELQNARRNLSVIEEDIQAKKQVIEEMRQRLSESQEESVSLTQRKSTHMRDIGEAEKVREECRGWSASELGSLKARVDGLEKKHGWTISSVDGDVITVTFKREICLSFDVAAFQQNSTRHQTSTGTGAIQIRFAEPGDTQPISVPVEKEFFLRVLHDQLQTFQTTNSSAGELLTFISDSWAKAAVTAENIRHLNMRYPTQAQLNGSGSLLIKSTLLLAPLATKALIAFEISDDLAVACRPTVVYGDKINEGKMQGFLEERIGSIIPAGTGQDTCWVRAIEDLKEKLLTRTKK